MNNEKLIELLAELDHEQWMTWAKALVEEGKIMPDERQSWESRFVPYSELSEEDKEKDREWARKALAIIEENGL